MIQHNSSAQPRTLMEAIRYFSDLDRADSYVASIKWPDGPVCPGCGSQNIGMIRSRRRCQCREKQCRKQFSLRVGTIFQDSPLDLDKWLAAIWMIANCRNGVSSCEIARTIGIKQQSAWHLLHRVRHAMKAGGGRRLAGIVESDETFVGGRIQFMHKARADKARAQWGHKNKAAVHAMLERDGEVRAMVVPRASKRFIQPIIRANVEAGSRLYTDASSIYTTLAAEYVHEFVNHAIEYVRGTVHTNGLENFFSLLRRAIKGTYVAVEPEHLDAYLDEQAYRFNYRKESDWQRFDRLMHRIVGRRLTYRDLTGGKAR